MCPWQVDAVKVAVPASPSTQGDDAKDLLLDTGIHSDMHHGVGNSSQCSKLRRKHLMADHDAFACPLHPGPSGVGAASSKDRAIKHDPVTQQVVMHADSSFLYLFLCLRLWCGFASVRGICASVFVAGVRLRNACVRQRVVLSSAVLRNACV